MVLFVRRSILIRGRVALKSRVVCVGFQMALGCRKLAGLLGLKF